MCRARSTPHCSRRSSAGSGPAEPSSRPGRSARGRARRRTGRAGAHPCGGAITTGRRASHCCAKPVSPLCALKPAPPEALAAMRPGCGSSPKKEDDNMPTTITGTKALDVRFPTSQDLSGSDAMNEAPDYSAAYVILKTDTELEGHGLTFTIGRGNELCVAAIEALSHLVVGETLESFTQDMGAFWRRVTGDSQLRWVGPEKGVIHLATAAIVNAVWDLYAKAEGKPLWKLLVDMSPEEIVRCVDFRYITDAITPEEALEILHQNEPTKAEREEEMLRNGFPAYTTSTAWLGYDDERLRRLCREAGGAGGARPQMKGR